MTNKSYKEMVRRSTNYEWTAEEIDEAGDIISSEFFETRKDAEQFISTNQEKSFDIGLVRTSGSEVGGVEERYWAYLKNGELPEYFSDAGGNEIGYKVPKKFS